jgi:hypothetical protein
MKAHPQVISETLSPKAEYDERYTLDVAEPVDIYRNLHKSCWSVRQGGLVKQHIENAQAFVMRDVRFVVSDKGRQRVLREKSKNVHAVARGILLGGLANADMFLELRRVTYNPYVSANFYLADDRSALTGADLLLAREGQLFVFASPAAYWSASNDLLYTRQSAET